MTTLRTTTRATVQPRATTTTEQTVSLRPKVRAKLLAELKAYQDLEDQMVPLKEAMAGHAAVIRRMREEAGERKMSIDGFSMTDVTSDTTFFDKNEFVERGGDLALYNDCLKKKPRKPYERITTPNARARRKKGGSDDDGDE